MTLFTMRIEGFITTNYFSDNIKNQQTIWCYSYDDLYQCNNLFISVVTVLLWNLLFHVSRKYALYPDWTIYCIKLHLKKPRNWLANIALTYKYDNVAMTYKYDNVAMTYKYDNVTMTYKYDNVTMTYKYDNVALTYEELAYNLDI